MKNGFLALVMILVMTVATACSVTGTEVPGGGAGGSDKGKGNGNGDVPINLKSGYYPEWGTSFVPSEIVKLDYDSAKSSVQNGKILADTILALTPGQRLEIGTGTFSINRWFNITVSGTADAPIEITAQAGAKPVITRPNASQNVINIGSSTPVKYLILSNLEIKGGDTLVKLYHCSNVWIHKCHIHNGNGVGIAANSENTDRLYLTNNKIHDLGGTAEGMYLGSHTGTKVMKNSIIAANHIYNCFGSQGDGIEVKQGSYNNWIVENLVHDTNYPCIIAYGTNGKPVNIIEKNIVYSSNSNTMQVQGDAIVRNNLIMAGSNAGFLSKKHVADPNNLQFVHNTVISNNKAVRIYNWNGKSGMIFANNAIYSQNSHSIFVSGGASGATISGNITFGAVSGISGGYRAGNGLSDFVNVNWQATQRDATPSAGSALKGKADPSYLCSKDLNGQNRTLHTVGAIQ